MDKIRIGMIRCDTHASWYGLLFAPADEAVLLEHWPQCQHYFYYRHKLLFETVPGFELTKVWDEDRRNSEKLAKVFRNGPHVCDSLEEVSRDVDLLFIADCYSDGNDHLALAATGLKKGIPTFVDKPFAYTLADARAIIDLARKHNTPVMSSSLLRVNPVTDQFRARFAEVAPVYEGVVKGVGFGGLNGTIHGLSLAQHVFGEGVEWVECMGTTPFEFVHLHYPVEKSKRSAGHRAMDGVAAGNPTCGLRNPERPDGIEVLVINSQFMASHCGYRCEVYGSTGAIHSPWIDDNNFPLGGRVIMKMLREMVVTRQPQMSYESMLELIEIVEACRLAQQTGKPVYLRELATAQSSVTMAARESPVSIQTSVNKKSNKPQ